MLDHDEVVRLYGPWVLRTPLDATVLLRGYPHRWWIAGGWAIDAFVGSAREHGDIDIGIPRADAEDFIDFISPHLDVWAASGSLTPMLPERIRPVAAECGNLWLRSSGAAPWEYDVLLEDVREHTWHYKRFPSLTRPIDECLWNRDGITYLTPEVQLLLKAKHPRDKDTLDLERCLPLLTRANRTWLEDSLREENQGHPWLELLVGR